MRLDKLLSTFAVCSSTCCAVFVFPRPAGAAGFTLQELGAVSTVDDGFSGMSDVDVAFITESPAQGSVFASVGLSTATTPYDFVWDDFSGTFLVGAIHEAEDVDSSTLFVRSSGGMTLTSILDLRLSFDASYSYVAPASGFFVRLMIGVVDLDQSEVLFAQDEIGGPSVLEPPSGTLFINDTIILPAGSTYFINYEMRLQSFASGTGIIATGDGHVDMFIETVPEPSTLSLLAIDFLVFRRRKRCCAPAF